VSVATDNRLKVVLCWHMHQPQYRDLVTGESRQPWAYLHGIKDYVDMAVHLENVAEACAVISFSPLLLEQLDDYCAQIAAHLRTGSPLRDPLLALLTPAGVPADRSEWPALLHACQRVNDEHGIGRFAPYRALASLAGQLLESDALDYASPQLLTDLAAWYHLAWFGETVHRGDPRVRDLAQRSGPFSAADLRTLLECIGDVLSAIVPRYRRLAGDGKIELSVSPWGHPILPLLFDFTAAREADPELELPASPGYPGGADRARWHVAKAIQVFHRAFGMRPRGCWPSEGAVSVAALELLESFGFDWVASGGSVLHRSLEAGGASAAEPACAYRLPGGHAACFFRDDELSDLIGFTYSTWHGDDAAANLVQRLEMLADGNDDNSRRAVAIVLDGENAWEHYPFNGYYFLQAVYRQLADHPRLRLSTFTGCLQEGVEVRELKQLVAGSWVHGSLATWIGNPSRNLAWDMLCDAKRVFDQVVVEGGLEEHEQRAAEDQLGVCEASDWSWWFADYNPEEAVDSFDGLYRRHLANLYRLLGEEVPAQLMQPLARGGGSAELGGTMLRAGGPSPAAPPVAGH
jgi:alpha-amylase/alpha-mannosidase (GH57 family)